MKTVLLLLLATVLPLRAQASEVPPLEIPLGVGVNIHFVKGHERDLSLIQAAGFRFIRMDFSWGGTERQKGAYDWSGYDELVANLEAQKLRPLFILDYSNDLYEERVTLKSPISGEETQGTASPQHAESVAAYAKWAGEAARHFKGRHVIWEIWNEPNINFWMPKPDVGQYTTLALAACKAIRSADPEATIVGPATSGFPWEFLESCFKAGLLEHWDAVSVHPYREYRRSPETAADDYAKLRSLIDRYAPKAKARQLPILSGEWGYATHETGISLETQAAFAVRQQLVNLLNNVPISIWYDWKNDGPDPKEREHNFGVVQADLQPKPAYNAISVFTRELDGYRLERRLSASSSDNYLLLFVNSVGLRKLAAWTVATEPQHVTVKVVATRAIRGRTGQGAGFVPTVIGGVVPLDLIAMPQYLDLRDARVESSQ